MPASPIPLGFVSAFASLRAQLACPACYGELRMDADRLICTRCGLVYPVVDGIPVLTTVVSDQ
jgi:hypothetical protein